MSEAEIKVWAGLLSPDSPLGLQMAALRLSSRGHPSVLTVFSSLSIRTSVILDQDHPNDHLFNLSYFSKGPLF